MAMVFDAGGLTPTQKLVMLSLADHANEEGKSIYPSVNRLCEKTSLGERTVRRTLGELRADLGLIRITGHSTMTHPNEYAINVKALKAMVAEPPATVAPPAIPAPHDPLPERQGRGATQAEPPATVAPKPSLTTIEPSKSSAPKTARAPKVDYFPLAEALASVCHLDLKANPRIFAEAELLAKASPSPTRELLVEHYNGRPDCYWRQRDWRGKKGEDPTPAAIRESWGKWVSATATGGYALTPEDVQAEYARLNPGRVKVAK